MTVRNFDEILKNLSGEVIMENKKKVGIKEVIQTALLSPTTGTPDHKFKCFVLAEKINKGGKIDIKAEEATLIKECVGTHFGPLVVGRVYNFLDA